MLDDEFTGVRAVLGVAAESSEKEAREISEETSY